MRQQYILAIIYLAVLSVFAQNLNPTGYPKGHADLHNSGIVQSARGLRSLDNTQLYTLAPSVYGIKEEGTIVFDVDGTAYIGLTQSTNSTVMRIHPNLTAEYATDIEIDFWSGAAIADDGTILYVGENDVTAYNWNTKKTFTVDLGNTDYDLYGPSPTIVNGSFYIVDGNANLQGYNFSGYHFLNSSVAYDNNSRSRNEFATLAFSSNNNVVYWCTTNSRATDIYAVRVPQGEVVWKFNATQDLFGVDPLIGYPNYCDSSSVLSPDQSTVYQQLRNGIVALNANTGAIRWTRSWSSMVTNTSGWNEDSPLASALINPIDGSVIVVTGAKNDSNDQQVIIIAGLSPSDGSSINNRLLIVPVTRQSDTFESSAIATQDGLLTFCTQQICFAADVASNPWKMLWNFNATFETDYNIPAISPDGSIWYLDDQSKNMAYLACKEGYGIDANGVCSPCRNGTVDFGTSCGFTCGNTLKLYHKAAVCDCGSGKVWDYDSVSCIDDVSTTTNTDSSTTNTNSSGVAITNSLLSMIFVLFQLLI